MIGWSTSCKRHCSKNLLLQELKIRKGTGRGRGRRSKREAGEEGEEGDYVDEGDFGFVEVWDQIVLKHELKTF